MRDITLVFQDVREINQRYELPNARVDQLEAQFASAKVCTPLIGKFSSGKSALLNTLLGLDERLLKEQITPETAVPTELEYADREPERPVSVYDRNDQARVCTLEEYRGMTLDANTTERVRIALHAPSLSSFPDVQLVDMPGFESGLKIHEQAIDGYLDRSMAYLITIPADDMVVRGTIGNLLRELCLHEMPLIGVITKRDKVNSEADYRASLDELKRGLKRYIGDRDLKWCETSSYDGALGNLIPLLEEIQAQSQELRQRKYGALMRPEIGNTAAYLQTRLHGAAMSESELLVEEEKLNAEMKELQDTLRSSSESFQRELENCAAAIKSDVLQALNQAESSLVSLAMNKGNVNEQMALIVRNALIRGLQAHYIPLVRQYIQDTAATGLQTDISANADFENFDPDIVEIIGPILSSLVRIIMAKNPLLARLIRKLILFVTSLIKSGQREETERKIRDQLTGEVYPQVLSQVEASLRAELSQDAQKVEERIMAQGDARRETLNRAMADLKARMRDEQSKKDRETQQIREDLARLEELSHGL